MGPTQAWADPQATVRSAIQAQYRRLDRALIANDFATVQGLFAPACTLTLQSEGRSLPAARFVEGLKAMSVALTVRESTTVIRSIRSTEGGYEVVAVSQGASIYAPPNRDPHSPTPKPAKAQQAVRDLWSRSAGHWQIVRRFILVLTDHDEVTSSPLGR